MQRFDAWIFVVCAACSAGHSAADEFGRLFTTPQERLTLERLRHMPTQPTLDETPARIEEAPEARHMLPAELDTITLNGVVYRQGRKSTVWLNGTRHYDGRSTDEHVRVRAKDVGRKTVSVTVPATGLAFDLAVGQTYALDDETVSDIIITPYAPSDR